MGASESPPPQKKSVISVFFRVLVCFSVICQDLEAKGGQEEKIHGWLSVSLLPCQPSARLSQSHGEYDTDLGKVQAASQQKTHFLTIFC